MLGQSCTTSADATSRTTRWPSFFIESLGFRTSLVQIVLVFFFSGFHLPERRNFHTDSWYDCCADSVYAHFLRRYVQIFCVQIFSSRCVQAFIDFFFDISRFSEQVFESYTKIRTRSTEKSAASPWPAPGGVPTPSLLSRADSMSHNSRQAQALREFM